MTNGLTDDTAAVSRPARRHVLTLLAVFLGELALLAALYQFFTDLNCHETTAYGFCRFLRSLVARAIVVFGVFGVLVWARPRPFGRLAEAGAIRPGRGPWFWMHLAGVACLVLPLVIYGAIDSTQFGRIAGLLATGAVVASVGAMFWLSPPSGWMRFIIGDRGLTPALLALAFVLPDLTELVRPSWSWLPLTNLTFNAVLAFLSMFQGELFAIPEQYLIGMDDFVVQISELCSGVEGIALVVGFAAIYGVIFRDSLRLGRYALVVVPLAVLSSWVLNVVRAGTLVLIGARVSPELAANGFHSHAGWLMFTALSLTLVYLVHNWAWLHREVRATVAMTPVGEDETVATFVPFLVFLVSGLATQALFAPPDLGYPFRVLVMAAAMAAFLPFYRRLAIGFDVIAVAAGLGVGLAWLALDQAAGGEAGALAAALGEMTQPWLAIWIAMRIVGTVAMVPLIEELFFRGYLLRRLDRGGAFWRVVALAVSSLAFAALHGRWVAAGAAGVVFGLVMLRRGRVGDAVVAHLVANLLIAIAALMTGDFAKI